MKSVKQEKKVEKKVGKKFLLFRDRQVAINHSEQLRDGSVFVILEKPALINRMSGPTQASSYYIIYKNGVFDVSPNRSFEKSTDSMYVNTFKDFLSREVRQELFCTNRYDEWPMVKIV